MKAISSKRVKGMNLGSIVRAVDNSGAKITKITGVKRGKSKKGRQIGCGVGDWVKVSVRKGNPDMLGKLFDAIIVRQKKPFKRKTGERVMFEENGVALLKDEKGNPKGTLIRGPVAREVQERFPQVAKIAQTIV